MITEEEYLEALTTVRTYMKQVDAEISNVHLNKSINELDVTIRTFNAFKLANIKTIQDILDYHANYNLMTIQHFGSMCYNDVEEALKIYGTQLPRSEIWKKRK